VQVSQEVQVWVHEDDSLMTSQQKGAHFNHFIPGEGGDRGTLISRKTEHVMVVLVHLCLHFFAKKTCANARASPAKSPCHFLVQSIVCDERFGRIPCAAG
jgi:hypothetical protein